MHHYDVITHCVPYTVKSRCSQNSMIYCLPFIYPIYSSSLSLHLAPTKWLSCRSCFTLNTISLFQGTITKVRLANSSNSYWLPSWRVWWLEPPSPPPILHFTRSQLIFHFIFNSNISPWKVGPRCAGKLCYKVDLAVSWDGTVTNGTHTAEEFYSCGYREL